MATRYELELRVNSATDLKNVNWKHGVLKPYVVVWVDSDRKITTRVDEEGDTCPNWNQTLVLPFDRPIEDAVLHIDVVHAYADEDTKPLVGSGKVNLREVVDDVGMGDLATRTVQLKRPSGRPQGRLEIQVSVRDPRYRAPDPYSAPPYGVSQRDYAAPPPYATPPAYGAPPPAYGAPPPAGYPYSAPPAYGQVPAGEGSYGQVPVEEEKKKGKFGGMGMGTGLAVGGVAGVLGGVALAEGFDKLEDHIADEAAERVEDDDGGDDGNDGDDGGDDGGW